MKNISLRRRVMLKFARMIKIQKEYLMSMVGHISNTHKFPKITLLKKCPHPIDYKPQDKAYLKSNSTVILCLTDILTDLKWSGFWIQTYRSPWYCNNLINKYAPKKSFFFKWKPWKQKCLWPLWTITTTSIKI